MFILKIPKPYLILIIAASFIFLRSSSLSAGVIHIQFSSDHQTISANIKQASLRDVIAKIKREKHVYVKGEHYLINKTITVEFKNLSLEDTMKRFLKGMNHSLEFDKKGNLSGVTIVGAKDNKQNWYSRKSKRYRRRIPRK